MTISSNSDARLILSGRGAEKGKLLLFELFAVLLVSLEKENGEKDVGEEEGEKGGDGEDVGEI